MGAFNANILPASTGLALGTQNQSWTAYLDNLFLYDSGGNLIHNLRTDGTASTLGGPVTLNGTLTGRNAIFNSSALGSPLIQGYDHAAVLVLQASESGSGGTIFSLYNAAGSLIHSLRTDTGTNQIGNNLTVGGTLQATDLSLSGDEAVSGNSVVDGSLTAASIVTGNIAPASQATPGAALDLTGGAATGTSPVGGDVVITGGSGTTSGGDIKLNGGPSTTAIGQLETNTIFNKYNNIALVADGIPYQVATVDLVDQSDAIATTNLYTTPGFPIPPSTESRQYVLHWNAQVTTAAGSSSTLGPLTIVFTSQDGTQHTITCGAQISAGTIATTSTTNTANAILLGLPLFMDCQKATVITYGMGYASSAANAMRYALHIRLTCVG